jgi:hypothetical protein
MDKDLLACLMAAFPDEFDAACRRESRDYLTIRGYRVSYDAGADPDILDLLSALCSRAHDGYRRPLLRA